MKFLLLDARLVLSPERGVIAGNLSIEDGVITDIRPSDEGMAISRTFSANGVIDCGGDFVVPGLIDIHAHGAMGRDAMEATPEAFGAILRYHASRGTTTMVLTTVAGSIDEMMAVLRCAEDHRHGEAEAAAHLAGIHLEGPYFSPRRCGAHRSDMLRHPSSEETSVLCHHAGVIRRLTLAPELPGALQLVKDLIALGVAVSAGHSDATEEEALRGFRAGITQVTHLHNAMSSLHKTAPKHRRGLAEAALNTPSILCEVIADGVHVSRELLREAWQAKGWERVVLVSDATAGAGLGEGAIFELGRLPCRIQGKAAWTGEEDQKRLAGSTVTMIDLVRVMVEGVGVPLAEAVAMASLVPSRSLGLDASIGSLEVGKRADLLRFSPDWKVQGVWMGGIPLALRCAPDGHLRE